MNHDFERRFGGLRRLYGGHHAQDIFDAHVVVVGVGGVGSWAAEALVRSGVGRITLVDMDHVSISNINRQLHATDATLGQAKVHAMRERLALINPACAVYAIDEFVTPENWRSMWLALCEQDNPANAGDRTPHAVIDACDQMSAKTTLAAWTLESGRFLVSVGAAGGKRKPHAVEVGDLSQVTHDPLLAQLRYRLRKQHGAARSGAMGVVCVFSREPVAPPNTPTAGTALAADGSLNCHGYGSVVTVTASFGLCAAGQVLNHLGRVVESLPGVKEPKTRAII